MYLIYRISVSKVYIVFENCRRILWGKTDYVSYGKRFLKPAYTVLIYRQMLFSNSGPTVWSAIGAAISNIVLPTSCAFRLKTGPTTLHNTLSYRNRYIENIVLVLKIWHWPISVSTRLANGRRPVCGAMNIKEMMTYGGATFKYPPTSHRKDLRLLRFGSFNNQRRDIITKRTSSPRSRFASVFLDFRVVCWFFFPFMYSLGLHARHRLYAVVLL